MSCKTDKVDVKRYLYTDHSFDSICSRDKPVFEGVPAPVSYLPFERQVFTKIVQNFYVHPTITRTIGREVAHFSSQHHRNCEVDGFKISS